MSRAVSNKSTTKSGSPMLAGILVGMVVGVALAAGVAWYILKSPSPFVNKEIDVKPSVEINKQPVETPVKPKPVKVDTADAGGVDSSASGVADAKPRFEFYKVLTDKTDATTDTSQKATDAHPLIKAPDNKPVAKYLQAGAFVDAADAENLKATLAMKGLEASVQTVNLPGKGEIHRVRVGPFQSEQEISSARGTLKLNGLDATPVH